MKFDLIRIIENQLDPNSKVSQELADRRKRARLQSLRRVMYTSPIWLTLTQFMAAVARDLKSATTKPQDDALTITGAVMHGYTNAPDYTQLMVTDSQTDRKWMREPVNFLAVAGANGTCSGNLGVRDYEQPYALAPSAQLLVDFLNPVAD